MQFDTKDKMLDASIPMCIADSIPVILFSLMILIMGPLLKSPLFWIGGGLMVMAGTFKVVWKFTIAIKHKYVAWLNAHFWGLLGPGLVLMITSLFINKTVNFNTVAYYFNVVPNRYFFLIALICWSILLILGITLDHSVKKYAWLKELVNIMGTGSLLLAAILVSYTYDYYTPEDEAFNYLESKYDIEVIKIDNGYFFDGPGTESAVVMYPGALVDNRAYAPLMIEFAKNGYDAFLCEMPMNLAMFGLNMADDLQKEYSYDHWYMAGHSLGGAMASSYVSKHLDQYDGILLLAAYSTKPLISDHFTVVSIYGENDTVLNKSKLSEYSANMPTNYFEYQIEGGNHAGFGMYGDQAGDSPATITSEEQIREAVRLFDSALHL